MIKNKILKNFKQEKIYFILPPLKKINNFSTNHINLYFLYLISTSNSWNHVFYISASNSKTKTNKQTAKREKWVLINLIITQFIKYFFQNNTFLLNKYLKFELLNLFFISQYPLTWIKLKILKSFLFKQNKKLHQFILDKNPLFQNKINWKKNFKNLSLELWFIGYNVGFTKVFF